MSYHESEYRDFDPDDYDEKELPDEKDMTPWGAYQMLECYDCQAAVSELADSCPRCRSKNIGQAGGKSKNFFIKLITLLVILSLICLVFLEIL